MLHPMRGHTPPHTHVVHHHVDNHVVHHHVVHVVHHHVYGRTYGYGRWMPHYRHYGYGYSTGGSILSTLLVLLLLVAVAFLVWRAVQRRNAAKAERTATPSTGGRSEMDGIDIDRL